MVTIILYRKGLETSRMDSMPAVRLRCGMISIELKPQLYNGNGVQLHLQKHQCVVNQLLD